MKCKDCAYYWKDEGEKFPTCKYRYDDGYAPCEVEEIEPEETEDEPETWEEFNPEPCPDHPWNEKK